MTDLEVSNVRPTIMDDLENSNALFDLRLPDGTFIRDVGVADNGVHMRLSGIDEQTPWHDEILSAVETKLRRLRRDAQQVKDAARLVAPRPRGS